MVVTFISKLAHPCTELYRAVQCHRTHRKVPTIAELYKTVQSPSISLVYCSVLAALYIHPQSHSKSI